MSLASTLRDRRSGTTVPVGVRSAVLYARVSSKDQEKEGYSIPAQQRLLREYAASHHFTITQEFVDIETAKATGRQGFTLMLTYLKKHDATCRTILVEKTDRLYRNIKDWVTIDELDLEIHFVKENLVHSHDSRSSEKFLHGIKVLMAKNYIDNLGEEASKGMLEKARSGIWPSYAPLGYQNTVREDGKRIITPDPKLAAVVTRLFALFATGKYSLKTLATKAHEEGLNFRKSGTKIPPNTLHHILRKRIYTGDFDFNGTTYHGTHEPLTDRATWERCQDILDSRKNHPYRTTHDFAFSGLVTCGHCGCRLVGEEKRKKSGRRYRYYHCTGYRGRCPEPYTRDTTLEAEFLIALNTIIIPTEIADWLTASLQETTTADERHHEEERDRLQAEIGRLQDRLDRMYEDKLDGTITQDFYEDKATAWRSEQTRLQENLTRLEQPPDARRTLDLLRLSQTAATLFPRQAPSEQRGLLTLLIKTATWKHEHLTVEFREPFDALRRLSNPPAPSGNGRLGEKNPKTENWLGGRDSNPDSLVQSQLSYR
jgi:site-specific DNA recombinase